MTYKRSKIGHTGLVFGSSSSVVPRKQDYKSLHPAVMFSVTMVNKQTDRQL